MNELIDLVKPKILDYCGINLAASQQQDLITYLEKTAAAKGMTAADYCRSLTPYTPAFDDLINQITVNETYFFREELQFEFLEKEIFPKYMGKNLTIWTASSSTGEEAISLLALALSMNVNLTLYASDIDDKALESLKKGQYSTFSLRPDGQKYHKLLELYLKRKDDQLLFHREFLGRIHSFKFNLIKDSLSQLPFAEPADIIFMRNVFIYFDKKTRALVTQKVSEKLKKGGLLFFSVNEIASMDGKVIPKAFYKTNKGPVYYFVKDNPAAKNLQPSAGAKRRMSQEVQKAKLQKYSEQNEKIRKAKTALDAIAAEKDQKDFDAKGLYEEICREINRRDFEKARTLANAITGEDRKKYAYFLQGYVEYQADNRAEADVLFSNAEKLSGDFWPAFFYHGMLLRDLGKSESAKSCFSKCRKIISDFGKNNPYDFTLDSFSPSYISSLCERFSMGGGQ